MNNADYYKVNYLYRDASNYKFRGHFYLDEYIPICVINEYLIENQFFLPNYLGLQILTPIYKNEDDHDYHEFEDVEKVNYIDNDVALLSKGEFLSRLAYQKHRGWSGV